MPPYTSDLLDNAGLDFASGLSIEEFFSANLRYGHFNHNDRVQ